MEYLISNFLFHKNKYFVRNIQNIVKIYCPPKYFITNSYFIQEKCHNKKKYIYFLQISWKSHFNDIYCRNTRKLHKKIYVYAKNL